ncbi:two-component system chemotaxis sensor kinase CheA [Natronospira proteinivora]|uniref:histidine kinase n=1 Tax=Natronospira proteinivora TaxID=1807133 RepID=A0ABT1G568_9GAMM|nr:chemotaxis protein CheA [Natronospira proteinivora]MCP1726456.1 two-component system chemotaxis sensor kinase CheA [Natronospira proteinivora]
MSFDGDQELLADFLVEAGEILDELGEQLVELEQSPDDRDLLNTIFRGFHTIKGGGSFLGLREMVDLCHSAEDVFDVLREGRIKISQGLMDDALTTLDWLQTMFGELRKGQALSQPPQSLIDSLRSRIESDAPQEAGAAPAEPSQAQPEPTQEPPPSDRDATDDEFEAMLSGAPAGRGGAQSSSTASGDDEIDEAEFDRLLDELHGPGKAPETADKPAEKTSGSDEITEEEFDSLLDELHGGAPGTQSSLSGGQTQSKAGHNAEKGGGDGFISDDEFESLMDDLHGKGRGPGAEADGKATADSNGPSPKAPSKQPASLSEGASESRPTQKQVDKPESRQPAKPASPAAAAMSAETTVRVDTSRLDSIMNLVGELVLIRNRLVTLGGNVSQDEATATAVGELDLVTSDLQGAVMQTRMQPVKKVFSRFPRVARDLARTLEKEVKLELRGEDTDLDKNLVEALADPLVHLVRNAVDHGIESPEVRRQAGKNEAGTVVLSAEQEGDQVLLTISDDGGGMNPDALRRKVVEKGLMEEEEAWRLDDKEAFHLIFRPGFSTKDQISDVSGRGVGMDVVKTRISQLNGTIEIDSRQGQGSEIQIRVPLTLAILPTLMVTLGPSIFALPLSNIREVIYLEDESAHHIDGRRVIRVRNRTLPLVYLQQWLSGDMPSPDTKQSQVVIVEVGGQQMGLVVEDVLGREEVVIKPLGAYLRGMSGYAGATITGDGQIALILDVPILVKSYGNEHRRAS